MAPYTVQEDFDATTFTVNPEPFDIGGGGRLAFSAVFTLIMLSGCAVVSANSGAGGLILAPIGFLFWGGIFWVGWRKVTRAMDAHKAERSQVLIHATDTDLRVGSASAPVLQIPYKQLHRLVVKNSQDGQYVGGSSATVVAGGTGFTGAASMATTGMLAGAANMAARAAAVRQSKYTDVSYQLYAEASGIAHALAQGMTEAAANGLMTDLSNAIKDRRHTPGRAA